MLCGLLSCTSFWLMLTKQLLLLINSIFSFNKVLFSYQSPFSPSSRRLFALFKEFRPIISLSKLSIFFQYSPSFSVTFLVISCIFFLQSEISVFLSFKILLNSLISASSLPLEEFLISQMVFSCLSMISAISAKLVSRSLHFSSYSFIVFSISTIILVFSCSAICASVKCFPFSRQVFFSSFSSSCCILFSADIFVMALSFASIWRYFYNRSSSLLRMSDFRLSMTLPYSLVWDYTLSTCVCFASLASQSQLQRVSTSSTSSIFSFSREPTWVNSYDTSDSNLLFYCSLLQSLLVSSQILAYLKLKPFTISSYAFFRQSLNSFTSLNYFSFKANFWFDISSCFLSDSISLTSSFIQLSASSPSFISFLISFSADCSYSTSSSTSSCFSANFEVRSVMLSYLWAIYWFIVAMEAWSQLLSLLVWSLRLSISSSSILIYWSFNWMICLRQPVSFWKVSVSTPSCCSNSPAISCKSAYNSAILSSLLASSCLSLCIWLASSSNSSFFMTEASYLSSITLSFSSSSSVLIMSSSVFALFQLASVCISLSLNISFSSRSVFALLASSLLESKRAISSDIFSMISYNSFLQFVFAYKSALSESISSFNYSLSLASYCRVCSEDWLVWMEVIFRPSCRITSESCRSISSKVCQASVDWCSCS